MGFHRKYLSDKDKLRSLPRTISIWTHADGKPEVLREGTLARTKITENGKKLRKSWGPVYAVLTESHLSLFKDQKSYDSVSYLTPEFKQARTNGNFRCVYLLWCPLLSLVESED
jgi:hypothetical protein